MKIKNVLHKDLLWPNSLSDKIYTGFSNKELEFICNHQLLENYEKKLPYKSGIKLYWPVENYSLGRCYREWLNLPSWCPLPFNGDHGVNETNQLTKDEENSKTNVYLTWQKERFDSLKKLYQKKILRVPHPWVTFRNTYGLKQRANSKGTIVFLSHSTFGLKSEKFNYKNYFFHLKMLPKEYHPLVLCLHYHDVNEKFHPEIANYGIPLISVGNWCSPYFVERFYDIISHFRFATSNYGGSDLFLCEEFGLDYFIMGDPMNFINDQNSGMPKGKIKYDNSRTNFEIKKFHLFKEFPPTKTYEKKKFVDSVLGLDLDEKKAKTKVLKYFLVELFYHLLDFKKIIKFFIKLFFKKKKI